MNYSVDYGINKNAIPSIKNLNCASDDVVCARVVGAVKSGVNSTWAAVTLKSGGTFSAINSNGVVESHIDYSDFAAYKKY